MAEVFLRASNIRCCMVTSVVKPREDAVLTCSALVQWHMLILLVSLYCARRLRAENSASTGRLRRWS